MYHNWFFRDVLSWTENKYYRTCRQLREKLEKEEYPISCVSRSSIGNNNYYNLHFKHKFGDDSKRVSDYNLKKLFDVEDIGLVAHYKTKEDCDEIFNDIILIDEDELDDIYFDGENLVFEEEFNLLENLDECKIKAQLKRNSVNGDVSIGNYDYDGVILISFEITTDDK